MRLDAEVPPRLGGCNGGGLLPLGQGEVERILPAIFLVAVRQLLAVLKEQVFR